MGKRIVNGKLSNGRKSQYKVPYRCCVAQCVTGKGSVWEKSVSSQLCCPATCKAVTSLIGLATLEILDVQSSEVTFQWKSICASVIIST
ncbi:hypothetical protein UPYG_G00190260 [Umbra pygmaea]|uniref:Uncharacterized protein n=1 Tax=Umbra pygmaea TaxID=75934 RepID=A0ABD0WSN0_UMBPY